MNTEQDAVGGNDFKRMIAGAYGALLLEYEKIDALNVFPVPDGDTGTNMLRTLGAVAAAVAEAKEDGIGSLAKRAADSAVMGARGNSGVILSQIIRGLGRGLAGKHEASSRELGKAFQYGILYAYRSVARPVEGTILTVARAAAKGAYHAMRKGEAIADILREALRAGERELARTPELLPALKEAGVVDAGGRGLLVFLQGCLEGLEGTFAPTDLTLQMRYAPPSARKTGIAKEIARPYCTEFFVENTKVSAHEVRRVLGALGDSLIVAASGEIVKVHIHTAHPGTVLEEALGWGALHDLKIDNMADQHQNRLEMTHPAPARQKLAVISVAAGDGLAALMRELGAAAAIRGGQSMNPSVEEFMDAVHKKSAERYILLPNNKNIFLTAQQVKKLLNGRAEVVETASAPQAIAALLAFDSALPLEENVRRMKQALPSVKEGAVTRAVRDSRVSGEKVLRGEYIGVSGGKVIHSGGTLPEALWHTVQNIGGENCSLVTLYYGAQLHSDDVNACADYLMKRLPGVEIEAHEGGQPLYYFIVSAE